MNQMNRTRTLLKVISNNSLKWLSLLSGVKQTEFLFLTTLFCSVEILVDGQVLAPKVRVKVDPTLQRVVKSGNDTDVGRCVYDFFLALAACNTIVPIVTNSSDSTVKTIDYQGESPDEQALVFAAAAYGFMLVERTSGHIVIDVQGERQR